MGYRVIASDIAQDKLDLALRCGAVKTVNSKDSSKVEIVQTGCTIVVTGVAAAYDFGIKATATGGKVIIIGVPHGPVPIDILLSLLAYTIGATNQGNKKELVEALQVAADLGIKPIYEVKQVSAINQGVSDVTAGKTVGRIWTGGSGEKLKFLNPKNELDLEVSLCSASEEDLEQAVACATEAFESGPWSSFTSAKRGQCIRKLADLMNDHVVEIAYFESVVSGKPITDVERDVRMSAEVLQCWADKIKGDVYPADDGFYKIITQEPLGVCAGITAWNGSLHFLAWKAGPALACGNTCIIKPSEKSPFGTLAVGYLVEAAGFPAGVLQILPGDGKIGACLASHMKVAKVSFTGSTITGRKIQEAATKSNMKRVTLELGGKSPMIIFDDCDLEKAMFWAVAGITVGTGQVCAATSRILIQDSIRDEFISKLKARFESITLGQDPQDGRSSYGPIIDKFQYDRVRGYIEAGKQSGATVLAGSEDYPGKGYYVPPTIFLNPPEDAVIYREEIFGPVLCVTTFGTEQEALQKANDTHYGLSGAVFTKDLNRALRVSSKVKAGTVCVNCAIMIGPQAPNGGFKQSGYGRELGEYALRHYTEPKTTFISST
ncbi:uncharacterized protein PV07_11292 [Cladophialophora immunda]|uniref:aldehyde dehydrogenase (NAD(+)) n=1 Tax=Cladophialophora immunda TaxID=569365 RepID=A0A0D2BXL8_9EURO|nr:uncharacterized protein PV07_11292 [Cladophialophora immunda]KIW23060.1 hypothetical protein PV07_11292 [Cladophialophora immunda]